MAVSVGDSELMITTVLTDLAIGVESILTSAKSALSGMCIIMIMYEGTVLSYS